MARIKEFESLLGSEKKMRDLLVEELARVKSTYGDRRRTLIVEARKGRGKKAALLTAGDLTPEKETWVVVTDDGLISRTPTARQPRLTGRSAPILLISAGGRDTLFLFEAGGSCAAVAVHTLPECDDPKDGISVARATPYTEGQQVVAGVAVPAERSQLSPEACVLLGSFSGMIKKTPLESLPGPSAKAFSVMNVAEGDVLGWARITRGHDEILLVSSAGQAIRFDEQDIRPMGLAAGGVMGMKLEGDAGVRLVGIDCLRAEVDLLLVREDGQAKRVALSQFPVQGRYGKGVLAWKCASGPQLAGAVLGQEEDRVAIHSSRGAAKSLRVGDAPRRTRGAAGKALIDVKDSDRVVRVTAGQPRLEVKLPPEPEPPPKKAASKKGKQVARRTGKKPAAKKIALQPASARPAPKPATPGRRPKKKGRGGR
jgi:DNA gyrase subunit A